MSRNVDKTEIKRQNNYSRNTSNENDLEMAILQISWIACATIIVIGVMLIMLRTILMNLGVI